MMSTTTALVTQLEPLSVIDLQTEHDEHRDYKLANDQGADIAFSGALIAHVSSLGAKNCKRWTELNLYRTKGGAYICEEVGKSTVEGEKDLREVCAANSHTDVINFFGDGWLAKKMYAAANIDATIHVA